MALCTIAPQRPGAALRPGVRLSKRRLAPVLVRAEKTEDLNRTASLRQLLAKPGILLVGFGGALLAGAPGKAACCNNKLGS